MQGSSASSGAGTRHMASSSSAQRSLSVWRLLCDDSPLRRAEVGRGVLTSELERAGFGTLVIFKGDAAAASATAAAGIGIRF